MSARIVKPEVGRHDAVVCQRAVVAQKPATVHQHLLHDGHMRIIFISDSLLHDFNCVPRFHVQRDAFRAESLF